MASLTDVARAAGVSLTTASMVLNKCKQENRVSTACAARVRAVAEQLGYIPNYHAQSMKLGRADVIAVAIDISDSNEGEEPHFNQFTQGYFSHLVGSIEMETRLRGIQMAVVGPDTQGSHAPDRAYLGIRQRRFDGMIVLGGVLRPDQPIFADQASQAPVVIIEPPFPTTFPTVLFDEAAAVRAAVAHLAELGHRQVLWVGETGTDTYHCLAREKLVADEACRAGIGLQMLRFPSPADSGQPHSAEWMINRAERAVGEHLAAAPRAFTAIVCYSDRYAIGVCSGLQAAGVRIPADVSVISFDDVEAVFATPRLTSVSHKLNEMGQAATRILLDMIDHPDRREDLCGHQTVISPELVIRQSTGPAPRP